MCDVSYYRTEGGHTRKKMVWMAEIKHFIYLPISFFTCLLTFLEREEGLHPSSPLIPAGPVS